MSIMESSSLYEILGVKCGADSPEIRRAFITEAKRWHPDKRPLDEAFEEKELAKAQFVAVHRAYEELMLRDVRGFVEPSIGDAAAVRRSADVFATCKDQRIEAEEHLASLRASISTTTWNAEQTEVLRVTSRRVHRAVEHLRMEEIAAQYQHGIEEACCAAAGLGCSDGSASFMDAPVQPKPIDGPRQTLDHLKEAFVEMAFDTWAAACPKWIYGG